MLQHGYTVQSLGANLGVAERTVYRWRSAAEVPKYVALSLEALELRDARSDGASRRPEANPHASSRGA
jgi:hypothetical protein